MGLLVRVVEYVHTPSLEIETSDGVKYFVESGQGGSLVIKANCEVIAEVKNYEVVVKQVKGEGEEWRELRVIHS